MITENSRVSIEFSVALLEMKLPSLIGRGGCIVEDLTEDPRKTKGYMVLLDEPFMDERLWFVPAESVTHAQ